MLHCINAYLHHAGFIRRKSTFPTSIRTDVSKCPGTSVGRTRVSAAPNEVSPTANNKSENSLWQCRIVEDPAHQEADYVAVEGDKQSEENDESVGVEAIDNGTEPKTVPSKNSRKGREVNHQKTTRELKSTPAKRGRRKTPETHTRNLDDMNESRESVGDNQVITVEHCMGGDEFSNFFSDDQSM